MSCEGGCGCDLTDDMRETVDRYTTVREHTVGRCRLIRTLREAGVRGAPPGSEVTVRDEGACNALMVWARVSASASATTLTGIGWLMRGDTLSVGIVVALDHAERTPLDVLGAEVEKNVRALIAHPDLLNPAPRGRVGPVLARNPYTRR